MKKLTLLLLILVSLSRPVLMAQKAESIEFEFRSVPTSTHDYKFIIKKHSVELIKRDLILTKKRNSPKVKKAKTSTYIHNFSTDEINKLESVISNYKLDSIGLYDTRLTNWGMVWKVKILRNSVTHDINLPNYHNTGLEALLVFINSIIPDRKKSRYRY